MKKIRVLFLILCAFAFIPSANAVSINDLTKVGDNINVKKDIDGTQFVAGNTVSVENSSNGLSFIAGNLINMTSESDYAFVAGNTINIKDSNFKDGFIAGNVINIDSEKIERDLYVAGSSITINGNIGRNAFIAGDTITIRGKINGNVTIAATTINIDKNAVINGTLKYNEDAKVSISKSSTITKEKTYKASNTNKTVLSRIFDTFESFANILVIGIILMFIFKKVFKKLEKLELSPEEILKDFGIGILFLLAVPLASLIVMCTVIGGSTGFILLGLYISIIYISTVFSTYYIANKLLDKKIENKYLLLTVSLAIVYILKLIPYISGLVTLFTVFVGLGIIYKLIYNYIKSNK